jgi:hypothetical protein
VGSTYDTRQRFVEPCTALGVGYLCKLGVWVDRRILVYMRTRYMGTYRQCWIVLLTTSQVSGNAGGNVKLTSALLKRR